MINVACIQPQVLQNREKCYFEVEILLKKLIENSQKLDIICLPERWVPFELNLSNNFGKLLSLNTGSLPFREALNHISTFNLSAKSFINFKSSFY